MTLPEPTQAPPTPLADSKTVLNPALVTNVTVLGGYALIALIIICATILAAVHDGSYSQQAFDLFKWVGLGLGIGAPITPLAHTLMKRSAS